MMFNLFSSRKEEGQEKFELISCPLNGKYCNDVRSEMNKSYAASVDFRRGKEFEKSLDALENAYDKTMELPESPCAACTAFFRSTITESVANIHGELEGMSKGLFSTNRYQSSCEKAKETLNELKSRTKGLKNAV